MAFKLLFCGSALAVSAALALPSAASAQVSGLIAAANPGASIFGAKAWPAALNQIQTTYKSQLDQIKAKQQQRQTLLAQLDKNGDKQVDDAELQAAIARKDPVVDQIGTLEREMQQLQQPMVMAQAFVLDTIGTTYQTSLQKIILDRKIGVVLAPEAFVYAPPLVDITSAVTAEVDRLLPATAMVAAKVTPPTGWQPTQQAVSLMQQWQQMQEADAQQQATAQQQAAAQQALGTAPRPGAAPAAGAAPRPAVPATGAAPARPATQQPATR